MLKNIRLNTLIVLMMTLMYGCAQKSTHAQLENAQSKRPQTCDFYADAQPIAISNYDGDAMEPCISLDGKILFFNNSNAANISSKIYFAKRVSADKFECQGILPGTSSKAKDMAPSVDAQGNFYFTSLRSFEKDKRSIYVGKFGDAVVQNVHEVNGDMATSNTPGSLNMDCCISPDGQILILSRAQFLPGLNVPIRSQLLVSKKLEDGSFHLVDDSALTKIAGEFAYAPAITSDNKEIYFTTANPSAGTTETKMVTVSPDLKKVSAAQNVSAVTGFAEAISVTDDKREIFFHKKVGEHYRIYHAIRRPE